MKPQVKYENGNLIAQGLVSVDSDKDGVPSLSVEVSVKINAMEAVGEIVKNEVPEWLKTLLAGKI